MQLYATPRAGTSVRAAGVMLNLVAAQAVTVTAVYVQLETASRSTVGLAIYRQPGSVIGSDTSSLSASWIAVTAAGLIMPATSSGQHAIPLASSFSLAAGVTTSLYITITTSNATLSLTQLSDGLQAGAVQASNAYISITSGYGKTFPLSSASTQPVLPTGALFGFYPEACPAPPPPLALARPLQPPLPPAPRAPTPPLPSPPLPPAPPARNIGGSVAAYSGGASASTSPFGSQYLSGRVQMLFLASELLAAGLAQGSTIRAVGFQMQFATPNAFDMSLTVSLTSAGNALNGFAPAGVSASVQAFAAYDPSSYLSLLSLTVPLVYDGASNLLVEVCHRHQTKNYDRRVRGLQPPQPRCLFACVPRRLQTVLMPPFTYIRARTLFCFCRTRSNPYVNVTAFTSVWAVQQDDSAPLCSTSVPGAGSIQRPSMLFVATPPQPPPPPPSPPRPQPPSPPLPSGAGAVKTIDASQLASSLMSNVYVTAAAVDGALGDSGSPRVLGGFAAHKFVQLYNVTLCPGQTIVAGTCGLPGASCTGDTVLGLYASKRLGSVWEASALTLNDDGAAAGCGSCSLLSSFTLEQKYVVVNSTNAVNRRKLLEYCPPGHRLNRYACGSAVWTETPRYGPYTAHVAEEWVIVQSSGNLFLGYERCESQSSVVIECTPNVDAATSSAGPQTIYIGATCSGLAGFDVNNTAYYAASCAATIAFRITGNQYCSAPPPPPRPPWAPWPPVAPPAPPAPGLPPPAPARPPTLLPPTASSSTSSLPPPPTASPRPLLQPPLPVVAVASPAVLAFTTVFEADYATVYAASAATRAAFTQAFVASVQGVVPSAIVTVDSVQQGSIRVAAHVSFPPAVAAFPSFACAAGGASECGTLLAVLRSAPGALFMSSTLLGGLTALVRVEDVTFTAAVTPQPAPSPSTSAASTRGMALATAAGVCVCLLHLAATVM
jgi:hypothetical protein